MHRCVVLLLVSAASALGQSDSRPPIGDTGIPFYSGNLGVYEFMRYQGTADHDRFDGVTDELIERLKRCSCTTMVDLLTWPVLESEPGAWDWSFQQANRDRLAEAGLLYGVQLWLHFPPRWYLETAEFVPYADLVNGATVPQLSLWSPHAASIADNAYRELAARFPYQIDLLRLALPSEYGEIGYCAGMTRWLAPADNAGFAYWCGDPYALADYRAHVLARYGTTARLNLAYGTAFTHPFAVRPPEVTGGSAPYRDNPHARRYWVEFIDWYHESWVRGLTTWAAIARRHLPGVEMVAGLGYSAERPCYGNDQGRHVAALSRLGLAAQGTTGASYFASRRTSSACRAYDVPYYTEPPGQLSATDEVRRVFVDASNGVGRWFDYLDNLDGSREALAREKVHLTGQSPVCDLALWLPTVHHWLHDDEDWPEGNLELATALRDLADYEVVCERMLRDGALETLGIRVLVLDGADWIDAAACTAALDWVERGNLLIVFAQRLPRDLDGRHEPWSRVSQPVPPPLGTLFKMNRQTSALEWQFHTVWRTARRSVGAGTVILIASEGTTPEDRAGLVSHFVYSRADYGMTAAPRIDGVRDGVWSTLLPDRILLYNTAGQPVEVALDRSAGIREAVRLTLAAGELRSLSRTP